MTWFLTGSFVQGSYNCTIEKKKGKGALASKDTTLQTLMIIINRQ